MSSRTWLVIDCPYILWRNFHSMQGLTWKDVPIGVIFGFFRDLLTFQQDYDTDNLVLCFDKGVSLREQTYPGYKETRRKQEALEDPEKRKAKVVCRNQIELLRDVYLAPLGMCAYSAEGLEADDIIASICKNLPFDDEAIIISSDGDMFQLLTDKVSIYSPHKRQFWTKKRFEAVYKIAPRTWVSVKAMAGCLTDDVHGLRGIGEKTALKFYRGDMKPHTGTYKRIQSQECRDVIQRNLPLVRLPYKGTPAYQPVLSGCNIQAWEALCDKLGTRLFRNRPPVRHVKRGV